MTQFNCRYNIRLKLIAIVFKQLNLQDLLQTLLIGVKSSGVLRLVAFIAIYNIATLLFVPGAILTIKGGCLFGIFWGSVYVLMAAMLGAMWAFVGL
ncbi:SNARE associated Golgi family protein [Gloeocapsa sp. PCC 7428]|uniref:DedA family protein n=1 Tax=Gloeocapsa sp. PCC 7428 TaxID=1173026 RepID=UPI0002A6098F|nr:DedA family protein [Gloeocapsa sp. PCC 7428]AFZ32777.1 SNARE associated Golgi family protein [Gloeocapsa sp. PCC 7428]